MTDVSDNACIESLRPKNVPEGLIALGTIAQVSDLQLKVQITGGVVCLIDRTNINQVYTDALQEFNQTQGTSPEPCKLSSMFRRGQQFVCKIIEKRPRKGYADALDIIATFDPTAIQEDNLPSTLLNIPHIPMQCAVKSVEDHGYHLDIGFKGIIGFLGFEESKNYGNAGKRLSIGQLIRCCLKVPISTNDNDVRVVQLSLDKELMKKSKFDQEKVTKHTLTERCIIPGSQSFLTIMSIRKEGLVVNFMNEFAGFVSKDHLKDPWHTTKDNYKISDQLKCSVLYYNSLTKTFALSLRSKAIFKKTLLKLMEDYHVGKIIKKAKVEYIDGTRAINFRIDDSFRALANVRDALDEDVSTMTKDELSVALDSAYPEGANRRCRIKSINLADLILVLSLKQDFMDLPFASIEELNAGDFIEVTIKKYVKDGMIVIFGHNLRAIILNTDLNDYLSSKSYKKYPIGKTIKARVLKVDLHKQPARVFLTNKEPLMDPKLTIINSYDKSFKGKSTQATISKVRQDGLIVELFNNIKGFISKRFLSSTPMDNLSDLFSVGQLTSCVVYKISPGRLLLGVIPFKAIMKMKKDKKQARKEGKTVRKLAKIDSAIEKSNKKSTSKTVSGRIETEDVLKPIELEANVAPLIKSRRQRSEEARLREEKLRETEKQLLDTDREPQSISDFERLILKSPNKADVWIRYSRFFLDNVETEKARIVCRRALRTINFRLESEKLRVWLNLIKIETKYGGMDKLRETIEEAGQTNDKMQLYRGCVKVLTSCGELDEAERLHKLMLKMDNKSPEVWTNYLLFFMEHRRDIEEARAQYDRASKNLMKSDLIFLKSRFAQYEFRFGDVERGKTIFENLLSDNPKRTDLWRVYESMIKKFGSRQLDTPEMREQNEQALIRIQESIELVSKKSRKTKKPPSSSKNILVSKNKKLKVSK